VFDSHHQASGHAGCILRESAASEFGHGERCGLVQRAGNHFHRVLYVVRVGERDESGARGRNGPTVTPEEKNRRTCSSSPLNSVFKTQRLPRAVHSGAKSENVTGDRHRAGRVSGLDRDQAHVRYAKSNQSVRNTLQRIVYDLRCRIWITVSKNWESGSTHPSRVSAVPVPPRCYDAVGYTARMSPQGISLAWPVQSGSSGKRKML
jgi:hypothetical protein